MKHSQNYQERPPLERLIEEKIRLWAPPPRITVSEWADRERKLSSEASAETGQWYTSRAEYQRGIMDAFCDPAVETVVVMSSSQVGKTEILLNVAGYFISQDPSPILVLQPTLDVAQSWSLDRLAPMLRDTPCLRGRVRDPRARDSRNTLLHKIYSGGHITIAGANSAASLASRPIRIVLMDEIDRYPASAGTEGDPVELARKRATTFWNRKIGLFSSPTIKDLSRIEAAYNESDQRKFYVPCLYCGEYQVMVWAQVRWPKNEPSSAAYCCRHCEAMITDADKLKMLAAGEWRAEKPCRSVAGFWLNELYSPWVTFAEMATKFVQIKRSRDPEKLKTFINTSLAETWDGDSSDLVESGPLMARREAYGPALPTEVAILTCGVDIQDDRIELEVIGWGAGEESWGIEYHILVGDPARPDVWKDLDACLSKTYPHESGVNLRIVATCIDTGGHFTQQAYSFIRPREVRRIFGVKGANRPGVPIISKRPTRKNTGGINLFMVGTDSGKDQIYGRLKIQEPGPGYMHFPKEYEEDFFKQLTAERVVFEKGVRKWKIKSGARNEALDIRIYSLAALEILKLSPRFKLDRIAESLSARPGAEKGDQKTKESSPPVQSTQKILKQGRRMINRGWINRWRG